MLKPSIEDILRGLALQDEAVVGTVLAIDVDGDHDRWLDQKTQALVRLGALIALNATVVSYQSAVIAALSAGATPEEIVGTIVAVSPLVGVVRVTAASPAVGLAMGYDLEAAFERLDGDGQP
jgi:alkylhydroperoxidase/carboxymuconolactone decarboxylase family protein YurZ